MTIGQSLSWAREQLAGGDSPVLDAQVLLCYLLDCERVYLMTWPERALEESSWQAYQELVERRRQGEPVAYLTGVREFWSLPLEVSRESLIPRADTEVLVEQALEHFAGPVGRVVDLGSGTGAIALAIKSERPQAEVWGVELQDEAQAVARRNARKLALDVTFVQGSWFEPLDKQKFDLVVSNPPYIEASDPHLDQGDVRYEPVTALIAEQDGLADLQLISSQAPEYLNPGGWLMTEHGWEQGEAVRQLFEKAGFTRVKTVRDYGGQERVTLGQLQTKE
ncbi:peptide chain release factor N(5)-glutamine methyltransferase [Dongshaea marina]|uniref:peptide chain release factor N(5)-glutamine methyltransferase n=1 Tax=Dongshaea marina TaxID=2047966 RepID=UPI0038990952